MHRGKRAGGRRAGTAEFPCLDPIPKISARWEHSRRAVDCEQPVQVNLRWPPRAGHQASARSPEGCRCFGGGGKRALVSVSKSERWEHSQGRGL